MPLQANEASIVVGVRNLTAVAAMLLTFP